ncbi:MAG: hypothetical protein AAFV88_08085 [Planctomycetota bacterium]
MIEIQCHCGNVRLRFQALPSAVRDCDCPICNRLGALWADFHTEEISISTAEPTGVYRWSSEDYEMHHCQTCGCTTHYTNSPEQKDSNQKHAAHSDAEIGVNLRMLERKQLEQIPVAS